VARAITVAGNPYTHGSRRVVDLFRDVVAPELERHNYKSRGVKTRLVDFIRTTDAAYADNGQFLTAFFPWLAQQTRRVRGGNTVPVLRQFSVLGMSRPAWPEALRTSKGVEAGDNLRHVVRNATLKRALDAEWNRVRDVDRRGHFGVIAHGLGIPVGPFDSADTIVAAIYRTVYLNPANLFAGGGTVNQVIGFAADPVRAIGEELLGMGDAEVSITDVYVRVMQAIYGAANKLRADEGYMQWVLNEINTTVQEAIGSLQRTADSQLVAAEEAGELVADIGLGFGFDLIDGRVPEDAENIARRQGRLLWSETALTTSASNGGSGVDLLTILRVFMGQAEIPG
jgi:hypothetical protein